MRHVIVELGAGWEDKVVGDLERVAVATEKDLGLVEVDRVQGLGLDGQCVCRST
ncbi:MAG TPA: hypothetical protein PLO50_00725 [Nitrospira sp.]|nr:hypothetical protein [Nitrospira sp.]